jgi:ABC-type transport system involved in cytochrome bd biosynthesis fused ATPase/permease subunit
MVLLDEPTAHLDPDSAALAHDVIHGLAASRTVVAVTHRPELVEQAAQHLTLEPAAGATA